MDTQKVIVKFAENYPQLIQMPISKLNLLQALESFAQKAQIHFTTIDEEGQQQVVQRRHLEELLQSFQQQSGKSAELCSFLEYLTTQTDAISFAHGYEFGSIKQSGNVSQQHPTEDDTPEQRLGPMQGGDQMSSISGKELEQFINQISHEHLNRLANKVVEENERTYAMSGDTDTRLYNVQSHTPIRDCTITKRSETEDGNIKRLHELYEFYTKKQYRSDAQTFDQIPKNLQKMDLTTWMLFNKDSNTTSIIGKQQMHGIFKKSAQLSFLNFQSFHKAILEVLGRIHPGNIANGWKMLGVDSTKSVGKRMSRLGVPSYIYQASHNAKQHLEDHPQTTKSPFPQLVDMNTILVSTPMKPKRPNNNKITLQKLAEMKVKPDFPLPEPEPEDQIYLKSYRLESDENGGTPLKNTYKMRHNKQIRQKTKQPQSGIMSRIDQRIMQMSKKL